MQVPGPGPKSSASPGPASPPPIPPEYLAMAAAQMHSEGRWPAMKEEKNGGK